MKKIILLSILLLVILSSCAFDLYYPGQNWYDCEVPKSLEKQINYYIDEGYQLTDEDYIKIIISWVDDNIEYVKVNETRSVQDILNDGYGDCASQAFCVLALEYKIRGIKGKAWKGYFDPSVTIARHVFIEINDNIYLNNTVDGIAIGFESYNFDEISDVYMSFQ